jgi:hypothetical protein
MFRQTGFKKMTSIGDFSFMGDQADMLSDAFTALTITNNWSNLRTYTTTTFMFDDPPEWLKDTYAKFKYEGHSGASHAMTMRHMEYIAKNGWENYTKQMCE